MNALTLDGKNIPLDKDGYLLDLNDWSVDVAQALAEQAGIELSPEHWEILDLLRDFYQEFQLSPATRPLIKYTALKLGSIKATACISIACSMAPPPNSPPSWRACQSRLTAYEHPCATYSGNTC